MIKLCYLSAATRSTRQRLQLQNAYIRCVIDGCGASFFALRGTLNPTDQPQTSRSDSHFKVQYIMSQAWLCLSTDHLHHPSSNSEISIEKLPQFEFLMV